MTSHEKRKTRRRPILDAFSFFVVIPKKGVHRLPVHDVSDLGIGFDFDIEGESFVDFPVSVGEQLDLHFYLNQSLYLPLVIQIMRVEPRGMVRRIGAELADKDSGSYKAFASFINMLDGIMDVAVLKGAAPR